MESGKKATHQLERHFKGVANHYRIEILRLVAREDDLRIDEITALLEANVKTISEHVRKLAQAGLVNKERRGRDVCVALSPSGRIFYRFIIRF